MRRRLIGVALAMPTGGLLGVAAWLSPSGGGLGTHQQLGLPECGWVTRMDLPCPTCGMTTAFAHSADGNLVAAFVTQPFGTLLAVVTAATLVAALWTAWSGTAVFGLLVNRWVTARIGWISGGLLLLAWGYKIATHRGWI
ncbi:MAG: DUF2752 domain-containing protein [Phycisphaerales bacterium]